jgi:hypothetical protein
MASDNQNSYLKEHLPYMLKMVRYTFAQMNQLQHYLTWNAHFESFAVNAWPRKFNDQPAISRC